MARLKFNPDALFEAVDSQRRARGMTWSDLSKQLRVSTSTIRNMSKRTWGIELDGVLGLTRWLGRTVESFAGGDGGLPPRPDSTGKTARFLRFDTTALYARGEVYNALAICEWLGRPIQSFQRETLF